jgi:GT2 family glycosyltransferase/glycosyltransferase involved in cell wall biosynthesis
VLLFVSYSSMLGGAERQLLDFASAFPQPPALACPDGPLAGAALATGLRVFGLRRSALDLRGRPADRVLAPARLAAHALEIRRLADALDPGLVVAWGMRPAIACALGGAAGRPFVFQHNDLLPGQVVGRLVRAAAARSALVVASSHAIARDLDPCRRLGSRLAVVHPGVDVDSYPPSGPPRDPPEVIVLGALVGWKRPDLALEAVALARRARPDVRVRMVGSALPGARREGLAERLRARASRPDLAGAVELTGAVADPRPELARAACLLHCADREPFGLVVLEALAAGRPAIVPASAGPSEIVEESCGYLYPPGDAAAAAAAILRVAEDPRRAAEMGARGRARVTERFSARDARRRYAEAVSTVLHRSPSTVSHRSPAAVSHRSPAAVSHWSPARPPAEVAIVTVTHNSEAELGTLLASVGRYLPGASVVVADSGSSDGSVELARGWPGRATVIELGENVGFGRACNRAVAELGAPVVALLNPDVELVDDSLLELAGEVLRSDEPARLLAPLVLLADGRRQDSVHPRPASAPDLLGALIPPAALPAALALPIAPWRASEPRRVGWAVGCAVVARTDTLRRLGPFDERIFLYGEDLDLGLRADAAGVQTWFWPSARVIHAGAHSSARAFGGEPFERLARGRHEVVARRLGLRAARLDDVAQALTFWSRGRLKRLLGRSGDREQRQLEAVRRVRRGQDARGPRKG